MASLSDLNLYARMAEAAYASLSRGAPNIPALEIGGMAGKEAQDFAASNVVVDTFSDGTGLSATIFETLNGKRVLAIRGTEISSIADLSADFILMNGYPAALNPQYFALRSQIDAWTASGALPSKFTVTGHSLGGYLAAAVALGYGPRVEATYTFNAPGLGGNVGAAIALRSFLGLPVDSSLGKVFNIRGTAGISLIAGIGQQLATPTYVETETHLNPIDNHRIGTLTDALAIYELAGLLDPALDSEGVGRVIKGAGNIGSEQQEDTLRAFYRTLGISAIVASDNRESYWSTINDLKTNPVIRSLAGKVAMTPLASPGSGIESSSKTNFGDFVALKTLSPFSLRAKSDATDSQNALNAVWQTAHATEFADWTADKNARLYGDTNKEFAYTDTWYSDRAGLLAAVLTANEIDTTSGAVTVATASPDHSIEYHYYADGAER